MDDLKALDIARIALWVTSIMMSAFHIMGLYVWYHFKEPGYAIAEGIAALFWLKIYSIIYKHVKRFWRRK